MPHEKPSEPAQAKVKIKPFRGFGKLRKNFERICALIAADGYALPVDRILSLSKPGVTDCSPCRSLWGTLQPICHPRGAPVYTIVEDQSALPTPTPTPGPIATPVGTPVHESYEPSLELLDAVSSTFTELADDEDMAVRNMQAAARLVKELRAGGDLSRTEAEYLDILCEYIMAPFISREIGVEAGPDKPAKEKPTPAVSVDDLFAF